MVDDQYAAPLDKFALASWKLATLRPRMSLAMRVGIAYAFLIAVCSVLKRFFFMPKRMLHHIKNQTISNSVDRDKKVSCVARFGGYFF